MTRARRILATLLCRHEHATDLPASMWTRTGPRRKCLDCGKTWRREARRCAL